MFDLPKVLLQYLLPKKGLTALAGRLARAKRGAMTTRLIRWFAHKYEVDVTQAVQTDLDHYETFNDFFTRALRPDARPMASADFLNPVDGAISQFGAIDHDRILQAKSHYFSITDLLAGDASLSSQFRHGSFANLYLSPKDYHRVHMPCAGILTRMIHVPGRLFSVNPVTARGVPNLFARNERVVCVFSSPRHGPFAMVLVGATIVGSMATVWHGVVKPKAAGKITEWTYSDGGISLEKGAEMGRFLLGSTVVVLFQRDTIAFHSQWAPGCPVRLGEPMGERRTLPRTDGLG